MNVIVVNVLYLVVGYESFLQARQGVLRTCMFSIFLHEGRDELAPGNTGGAFKVVSPEQPGNHVLDNASRSVRSAKIVRQQIVTVEVGKYIVSMEMFFGCFGRVCRVTALYLVEQIQGMVNKADKLNDDHRFVVFSEIILLHGTDVFAQPST